MKTRTICTAMLGAAPLLALASLLSALTACGGGGGGGDAPVSRSWGQPELIENDDSGSAILPQIAMDAAGNAIATWQQQLLTFNPDVLIAKYTVGTGWAPAWFVETNSATARDPQIAVDPAGNAVLVWTQFSGARGDIWANRLTAGDQSFGVAELVETDDRGSAEGAVVAIDPLGRAVAVWSQTISTHLDLLGSQDSLSTVWGPSVFVEAENAGSARDADIAVDASGSAVAVWAQFDGTRYDIRANRKTATGSWGVDRVIENDAGNASQPSVAVSRVGDAVAVWEQDDGVRRSIWANQFSLAGGWGTAALIELNNDGNAGEAQVAVDTQGNAIAVWSQATGTLFSIWASRHTASGGWSTPELIETDDSGSAHEPQLAFDGSGNAHVVWSQVSGVPGSLYVNIWTNHFSVSSGWGQASLLETNDVGDAYTPQIAVDTAGNALAVWFHEFEPGGRTSIWACRFD